MHRRQEGPLATARLRRLAALVPAPAFLLVALAPPPNHDVAVVLNFAERMPAGERLYIDIIDVNAPLILARSLLPAAIGAWTPLDTCRGCCFA